MTMTSGTQCYECTVSPVRGAPRGVPSPLLSPTNGPRDNGENNQEAPGEHCMHAPDVIVLQSVYVL
eukprot:5019-Heterococcus_DN1.PRE.2